MRLSLAMSSLATPSWEIQRLNGITFALYSQSLASRAVLAAVEGEAIDRA